MTELTTAQLIAGQSASCWRRRRVMPQTPYEFRSRHALWP